AGAVFRDFRGDPRAGQITGGSDLIHLAPLQRDRKGNSCRASSFGLRRGRDFNVSIVFHANNGELGILVISNGPVLLSQRAGGHDQGGTGTLFSENMGIDHDRFTGSNVDPFEFDGFRTARITGGERKVHGGNPVGAYRELPGETLSRRGGGHEQGGTGTHFSENMEIDHDRFTGSNVDPFEFDGFRTARITGGERKGHGGNPVGAYRELPGETLSRNGYGTRCAHRR